MKPTLLFALGLAASVCAPPHAVGSESDSANGDPGAAFDFALFGTWESHYVSEGRDNLLGDDLVSTMLEATFGNFFGGLWYGRDPGGHYDELNLIAGYGFSIGDVDVYATYTHLEFFQDRFHDHEVGFGAAWKGLPYGFTPAVDAYYSFDAGQLRLSGTGWFFEFSLRNEYQPTNWLLLQPSIVLGVNSGYIAEGHNGLNHLALRLDASVPLNAFSELGGYIAWNQALHADRERHAADLFLDNFLYAGLAATIRF